MAFFPPSIAKATTITIKGGDYSSPGGGEGEGMRINTRTPSWKIIAPKSSPTTLNDLRRDETIPSNNAIAYLSAPAFIGYMVKDPSLLDINALREKTGRNIRDDGSLKISIGTDQFIVYRFSVEDPVFGIRVYQDSIKLEEKFIKQE